ncbi:GAMMA TUBULIN COMPLEX PROTEIN 3, spindle pole body component 98 [Hibiscus trionum]|uniref:GAMMA TUBULIN COMPLEX PROTEIN 3, spindle pole body component 98 n=1 Tax=Hibiscus trionum TaxID=183268 RepID=A0A9W7JEP1_HIBTR|nr:GAMMA TUBULIN COMPLEX PROTEIN 3, spindle pole body component 98 [Hibiscus trionum]
MEEEDQRKVTDLVIELVRRLLSQQNPPPSSPHFSQSLRYAFRILSSRLTPSVSPDADAVSESIKRCLATQGNSSDALTFSDLYTKFASKNGSGSVNNKWAVLYLLKIISADRKNAINGMDSSVFLPNLGLNDDETGNDSRVLNAKENGDKAWKNGVLLVSKDPQNLREVSFREFGNLVKEENEVTEEVLVRDVINAKCD